MYSVIAVANYFIQRSLEEGIPITNFQVQKMSFFAHAAYYHNTGKLMIIDPVMAWQHGPVFPDLYIGLKDYGNNPITEKIAIIVPDIEGDYPWTVEVPEIDKRDKEVISYLDEMWKMAKDMSVDELRWISIQNGGAWYRTVKENGINNLNDENQIKDLTKKQLIIPNQFIKDCGI